MRQKERQELGKEGSGIILKNVHGTDCQGKAFRLTGLALASRAGHSVSAGPQGEGPPSLYGRLCQCSRLLAGFVLRRDAALGSL